jgi:hypothetical protein
MVSLADLSHHQENATAATGVDLAGSARAVARGQTTGLVYTGRWYAEPNNIRADAPDPG